MHGSWLNMAEGFFSKMTKQTLRGIRVKSKCTKAVPGKGHGRSLYGMNSLGKGLLIRSPGCRLQAVQGRVRR